VFAVTASCIAAPCVECGCGWFAEHYWHRGFCRNCFHAHVRVDEVVSASTSYESTHDRGMVFAGLSTLIAPCCLQVIQSREERLKRKLQRTLKKGDLSVRQGQGMMPVGDDDLLGVVDDIMHACVMSDLPALVTAPLPNMRPRSSSTSSTVGPDEKRTDSPVHGALTGSTADQSIGTGGSTSVTAQQSSTGNSHI